MAAYKLKVNAGGLYALAEDGESIEAQEAVCLSLTDSARNEIVKAEFHANQCNCSGTWHPIGSQGCTRER